MAEGFDVKMAWGRGQNLTRKPVDVVQTPIVSLCDIMAEQFQEDISGEQNKNSQSIDHLLESSNVFEELTVQDCTRDYELACLLSTDPDCANDLELAEKLQREYDREVELEEQFRQSKEQLGIAKATLSADSYYYLCDDDNSSDEEEDDDLREFATNLLYEKSNIEFPPCGFVRSSEGVIVTKHDREINDRKNGIKAMQLSFNFCTGNMTGGKLSDKVLNELRSCDKLESRKHIRIKDKDEKATNASSVDALTRLTLIKWINAGEFDRVEGVIAMGKESTVLHAISSRRNRNEDHREDIAGPSSTSDFPDEVGSITSNDEVITLEEKNMDGLTALSNKIENDDDDIGFAIKVFRTSLSSFRNRSEYVKDDFRFKNPRRVMKIWAEKEFLNLNRLRRANIKCPTAIRLKKHVLLMSLIGTGKKAAPKLKDVEFTDANMKVNAFLQVKEIILRMFNECKLVHGDLSEFNLLWYDDIVYVIDVAQGMDLSHPRSLVFLLKDIVNVLNFFQRIGTENLPAAHELFAEVTQISIFDPEKNLFTQVENFEFENRSAYMRRDKAKPADLEWRLYNAESTDRSCSPSKDFN